ncbi:O-methyltransferase [Puerhibacterium puerhi]|uniref:O-methyltransferase n=1 Tax=Puerhibacterium puerhi TaxID=2692623 RepID=UPI001357285F|nr:O-methyltransferase [Puerhibacterium puerhi]
MEHTWDDVDTYLEDLLVPQDEALAAARESSARTTMPHAAVSPAQGRFLALLAQAAGARRVLELGTLAGYSTIWFARAVGPDGRVTTLELEEANAAVARENLERAGVADRVDVVVGPAAASAQRLVDDGVEAFDLVFVDADKPSNPQYLRLALELTRPGSLIVVDNVVRAGAVADAGSDDPRVLGSRRVLADVAADDRLEATVLQTVGGKGWDGFALVRRVR